MNEHPASPATDYDAWSDAHLGALTSRHVSSLITAKTKKLSSQREATLYGLVAEWLTGQHGAVGTFQGNAWTDRGLALEPQAHAYAAMMHPEWSIRVPGLIWHKDWPGLVGSSPDWLINEATPGEVKCCDDAMHVRNCAYGLDGRVPDAYVAQCNWHAWVLGADRYIWMAYSDRVSGPQPIIEAPVDPAWQAAFSEHVPTFVREMLDLRERMKRAGYVAALEEATE